MKQKLLLRRKALEVLKSISDEKRMKKAVWLHDKVISLTNAISHEMKYVLSFCSLKEEISTVKINEYLVEKKMLLLPRVMKEHLEIYYVSSLHNLTQSSFGVLEPDVNKCTQFTDYEKISHFLIPGLAFDKQMHRLGRGFGYYDRFLKNKNAALFYGVGFSEQLFDEIPTNFHDISMKQLLLF